MLTDAKARPAKLRDGGWGARVLLERTGDRETVAAEIVDKPITIETRTENDARSLSNRQHEIGRFTVANGPGVAPPCRR